MPVNAGTPHIVRLTTCLNNRLYSIFLIRRQTISTNCAKDGNTQAKHKNKTETYTEIYRVCKQLKQKWRATNVFSSAAQTESDARHVPCCENTKKKKIKINEKWQNARIVTIKRKITNKQTSENIYKLIPGRRRKITIRKCFFFYFILHAVDLAASSIVPSASVLPPSSSNNNNNDINSEYSGNCIMCSDLNRINVHVHTFVH